MRRLMMLIIKFYQKFISPLFGAHCRFEPTCSQYSYEAFEKYGFCKGFYLTVKRLIRCHPYSTADMTPSHNIPEVFDEYFI
jgi:putative membrane protein insertion efficiency factor